MQYTPETVARPTVQIDGTEWTHDEAVIYLVNFQHYTVREAQLEVERLGKEQAWA